MDGAGNISSPLYSHVGYEDRVEFVGDHLETARQVSDQSYSQLYSRETLSTGVHSFTARVDQGDKKQGRIIFGLQDERYNKHGDVGQNICAFLRSNGNVCINGNMVTTICDFGSGDEIKLEVDLIQQKIQFFINGTTNGDPFDTYFPVGVKMLLQMYEKNSQITFLGVDLSKQSSVNTTQGPLYALIGHEGQIRFIGERLETIIQVSDKDTSWIYSRQTFWTGVHSYTIRVDIGDARQGRMGLGLQDQRFNKRGDPGVLNHAIIFSDGEVMINETKKGTIAGFSNGDEVKLEADLINQTIQFFLNGIKNGDPFAINFPEGIKMLVAMYHKNSQITYLGADISEEASVETERTQVQGHDELSPSQMKKIIKNLTAEVARLKSIVKEDTSPADGSKKPFGPAIIFHTGQANTMNDTEGEDFKKKALEYFKSFCGEAGIFISEYDTRIHYKSNDDGMLDVGIYFAKDNDHEMLELVDFRDQVKQYCPQLKASPGSMFLGEFFSEDPMDISLAAHWKTENEMLKKELAETQDQLGNAQKEAQDALDKVDYLNNELQLMKEAQAKENARKNARTQIKHRGTQKMIRFPLYTEVGYEKHVKFVGQHQETIVQVSDMKYSRAFSRESFLVGVHSYTARVDRGDGGQGRIVFGLIDHRYNRRGDPGVDTYALLWSDGEVRINGNKVGAVADFDSGDEVKLSINLVNQTIQFFLNGMKNGPAFHTDFPEGVKMRIAMYHKDSKMTYLGADIPERDTPRKDKRVDIPEQDSSNVGQRKSIIKSSMSSVKILE